MAKTGRNEPCPCGSGKKYKNCHWGQPLPSEGGNEVPVGADPSADRARALIPGLAATLVLGGIGAFIKGGEGLLVGAAIGVFVGIGWILMQNPPPPSDNSGGSSINFGN